MKLRIILVVLSLLAFLSTSIGGFLYYSSLRESAFKEAERQSALEADRIKNGLSSFLSENLKSVKALAGLEELKQALLSKDDDALVGANFMLDHFNNALGADVCYLMDNAGNTVASSNRNATDSFVGENFGFRPYWRQAVKGNPVTYMALGITSKKRGVYYSHPIYVEGGNTPIGVAVIKASIESIEQEFSQTYEGIVLLTDPHGIIFISNREDWLFHSLWELSPEDLTGVVNSLQFGIGPWKWIGLEIKQDNYVVDESKNEYLMYRKKVEKYPGWNLVYLRNLNAISRRLSDPFLRIAGVIILSLCGLIGLSVFSLYKKASYDIIKRIKAEEELKQAKEGLSSYSKDLERQVNERTREISGILRYTPAVVYIKDKEGKYLMVNSRYEELFGIRTEDIRGKTAHDIFPKELADQFQADDLQVFNERRASQVEEQVPLEDGIRTYDAPRSSHTPPMIAAGSVRARAMGVT